MSEKKLKRRRFLADLLFAGGGLTAAAFLAKAGLGSDDGVSDPIECGPEQPLPGMAAPPKQVPDPPPSLDGEPAPPAEPEPNLAGNVQIIEVDGDVAYPEEGCRE